MDLSLLNWNPRGLNNPAKRRSIQRFVSTHCCNMIVLQETKLADVSASIVAEALGARFASNFIFKPASGTRGGILVACSDDFSVVLVPLASSDFFITGTVTDKSDGSSWSLTAVYGPQDDHEKIQMLAEFRRIKSLTLPELVILGDYNLMKSAHEKSTNNLNLRTMGRFR
uniref:Uncharacterized protein n=1 Tax=Avena sativa TaxID=4498 RepID=A0ACD5YID6_AVESA